MKTSCRPLRRTGEKEERNNLTAILKRELRQQSRLSSGWVGPDFTLDFINKFMRTMHI